MSQTYGVDILQLIADTRPAFAELERMWATMTDECQETGCSDLPRPTSDWCQEHGCLCSVCDLPIADGEDYCAEHGTYCPECGAPVSRQPADVEMCAECLELVGEAEASEPDEDDYELVTRFDTAGDPVYQLWDRATNRLRHQATSLPALRRGLDASNYRPNCWTISDHGNAHLVTDWS